MSTIGVEEILSGPPDMIGSRLIEAVETQWLERKSARTAPKDIAVALVALANAEGGVLAVGLHDGRVESLSAEKLTQVQKVPVTYTTPPVRARLEVVHTVDADGGPATLAVFRVEPGEGVHTLTNDDCYLRVGDASRKLTFAERQELEFDRGSRPFDGTPALVPYDALDRTSIDDYRRAVGATRPGPDVLESVNLLTSGREPTVAAYLLFGSRPQETFPNAYVRVLRFLDVDRGTGSRLSQAADGDVRCEGGIPDVLDHAAAIIDSWVPARRALGPSGRFEAVPVVPRAAWLEGLVNAVIHRSYSFAGDHIRVEIYPNRVEIVSPGRFPGIVDPTRPLMVTRYARNPRIARVCADLNIGRELGEGIHRMFEEMRGLGLTDPSYHQSASHVTLTLLQPQRCPPSCGDACRETPSVSLTSCAAPDGR